VTTYVFVMFHALQHTQGFETFETEAVRF